MDSIISILVGVGGLVVVVIGALFMAFRKGEKSGRSGVAEELLESERRMADESANKADQARAAADAARDDYDSVHVDPFNRDNRSRKTR